MWGVASTPARRSRIPRTTNSISIAARIANGSQNGIAAWSRAESSQSTTKHEGTDAGGGLHAIPRAARTR